MDGDSNVRPRSYGSISALNGDCFAAVLMIPIESKSHQMWMRDMLSSSVGKVLHADRNGSLNILRKSSRNSKIASRIAGRVPSLGHGTLQGVNSHAAASSRF
jgi:hypothetical protein